MSVDNSVLGAVPNHHLCEHQRMTSASAQYQPYPTNVHGLGQTDPFALHAARMPSLPTSAAKSPTTYRLVSSLYPSALNRAKTPHGDSSITATILPNTMSIFTAGYSIKVPSLLLAELLVSSTNMKVIATAAEI